MSKAELLTRTKAFALRILKLVDHLPRTTSGRAIGNQLVRSGTSVGANYRAACRSRSRAEFAAKLGLVAEEADETVYWLKVIRDGNLLRPVAPFFELWVRGDAGEHALTAAWLKANSGSLDKITYTVTAANKKAARRCGVPSCAFSATVRVSGNDHRKYPLLASSPKLPSGEDGLVLPNSPIPLGHFQVIKPVPGAAMDVDLNVLRVRFTPARGEVYGPRDMQAKAKEARILDRSDSLPRRGRAQCARNPFPHPT